MLSAARKEELKNFYKKLNIKNLNDELMNEALTHRSYNSEQNITNGKDYERLEFLGDSILRISVSEFLFDKYSDYDEGKLTKIRSCLVSDKFLHYLSSKIEIAKYISIGKHEEKCGGREKESIIACSMEAVMGAIYKSTNFEQAKRYVISLYSDVDINEAMSDYNAKEMLQEYTQAKNKDLPEYKIINETGKAHDKTYEVGVYYHNKELARGIAKTKRDAEKIAALSALKLIKEEEGQNE